jgi:hypothetical protein
MKDLLNLPAGLRSVLASSSARLVAMVRRDPQIGLVAGGNDWRGILGANCSGICLRPVEEPRRGPRIIAPGSTSEDETMKLAIALAAAAGIALAIPAAQADETRVGVGVGPVGAGVTVGESHERERTTVIRREDEPRERTTIIRKEREEPDHKVIIKERDRD